MQNNLLPDGKVEGQTSIASTNNELILHPTESSVAKEPTETPLTFGEKMVGIKFNPSELSKVDQIKRFFADQIDDINQRNQMQMDEDMQAGVEPDQAKFTIGFEAIVKLKEACMWTVNFHVI